MFIDHLLWVLKDNGLHLSDFIQRAKSCRIGMKGVAISVVHLAISSQVAALGEVLGIKPVKGDATGLEGV